jgi:hypothetical protein
MRQKCRDPSRGRSRSGRGAKRGDQRAETVVRRGALVNRIADLHCVVVYRLRAQPPHARAICSFQRHVGRIAGANAVAIV